MKRLFVLLFAFVLTVSEIGAQSFGTSSNCHENVNEFVWSDQYFDEKNATIGLVLGKANHYGISRAYCNGDYFINFSLYSNNSEYTYATNASSNFFNTIILNQ